MQSSIVVLPVAVSECKSEGTTVFCEFTVETKYFHGLIFRNNYAASFDLTQYAGKLNF